MSMLNFLMVTMLPLVMLTMITKLLIIDTSRSTTAAFSLRIASRNYHGSLKCAQRRRCFPDNNCPLLLRLRYKNPSHLHRKSWLSQQQSSSSSENSNGPVTPAVSLETTKRNIDNDTTVMGIPSMEQLRTDSFMKQVQYAEFITGLIEEDNGRETDVLMNRLRAQLSHPDGIRGFMATFLTTTPTTTYDSHNFGIPLALIKAIIEQIDPMNDKNELISLMCMNVIMPTGMITMQPTEEMSQQSTMTAKRAVQLLQSILDHCDSNDNSLIRQAIVTQCDVILSVAISELECSNDNRSGDDKLHAYWKQFFHKWGYQSKQQADIADAIRSVLSVQT